MQYDLKSKTPAQLKELVESLGGKGFLAKYLFSFIHTKNVRDINEIAPVSKSLREKLVNDGWGISCPQIIEKFEDSDGTVKYLFEFDDGVRVEAVLLIDGDRKTICISTQIGCTLACEFCATGKMKFKRNLSSGEIVSQVYAIESDSGKINNVVYMGMGEPFLNYDATMDSVRILNNADGRNVGIRHITVSTCGLANKIEKFSEEDIAPRLAISLHAADDTTRNILMPINKKFPLKRLSDAIKNYQLNTGNRVTFEYIMIKGINDTPRHAESLIKYLRPFKCNVNLIEYNRHSGCEYEPSSRNALNRFADYLRDEGIETVIRFKRGQNIKAACGQLGADWLEKKD